MKKTLTILFVLITIVTKAQMYPACTGLGGIDWDFVGAISSGSTFTNSILGTVTVSDVGSTLSNAATSAVVNNGPFLHYNNENHTLNMTWTTPVTSMIVPLADMDFNEFVTLVATGATFTPTLLGPTDSWTTPNKLSGTGNDLNSSPTNYSLIKITAPGGITSLQFVYGNAGITGTDAMLDVCVESVLNPTCTVNVTCNNPFIETFGSITGQLPTASSSADGIYTGVGCGNGTIVASSSGAISTDYISDGSSTHFLFHKTNPCAYFPGMSVWRNACALNVIPGETYEFSYYARLDNSTSIPTLSQFAVPATGSVTILSSTSNVLSTSTWVQNKMVFTVSVATSVILTINNNNTASTGNDFGIDNVMLTAQPPMPTPTSNSVTSTNCINTAVNLTLVQPSNLAGYTYQWLDPFGALVTTPSSVTVVGSYTLQLKSNGSSCVTSATVPVNVSLTNCSFTVDCSTAPFIEDFGVSDNFLPYHYSTADPSYTTAVSCYNGYIVSNSSGIALSTGAITADYASDGLSTHFLFHENASTSSACTYTPGMSVWVSTASIYVVPNEVYEFSYYCRLDRATNPPVLTQTVLPALGIATILSSTSNLFNTSTWIQNKITFTVSAATTIALKIKDATILTNGNDFGLDYIVLKALPPTLTLTASSASICAGSNSTLTVTGATNYKWMPSGTTGSISVVTPSATSIYTATGMYGVGCPVSQIINIATKATPTVASNVSSATLCASQSITLTTSGASTYTWSPNTSNSTTVVVTPSITTIYTIVATNSIACSSAKTITVTVNPTPTLSIASISSNTICLGNSSTITPTGANTYTILPSNVSGTSFTLNPLSTTSYTILGTSALGCNSNSLTNINTTVTVNSNPTLSIVSAPSSTICSGKSTTLTASGAITYTWSGGPSTSNYTVTPLSTTIYTVLGTNAVGCTNSLAPQTVTVNPTPTVGISSSGGTSICSGQTTTLIANGATTYTWSTGSSATSIPISPTVTTTYTLAGTSSLGCVSLAPTTVTVTINNAPTLTAVSSLGNAICTSETTTLTASGANTYTWSNGINTFQNIVTPTVTTSYTLTGTSAAGCTGSITPIIVTITVNVTPTITASSVSNSVICDGNSTVINPAGASTYTLYPNVVTGTSFTITPTATAIYTITGTSAAGCVNDVANQLTTTITVNATPTISLLSISPSNTICNLQTVTITPTGATANYTLMANNITNNTQFVLSPTVTTTYTLSGENSTGCVSTSANGLQVTIVVNPLPSITVSSQQNVLCFGDAKGSASLTSTGGTGSSTITPLSTSNLTAGSYTYTTIDDVGCSTNTIVSITQPIAALAIAPATIAPNTNCNTYNGSASANITGGTPTYSVIWSNGETTTTAVNLNTGISTFTVMDANGCIVPTGSINLTGVTSLTVSVVNQASINCVGLNTGIVSFTTSGTGPFSYSLSSSTNTIVNTTGSYNSLSANDYTLYVTGLGACSDTETISVTQPLSGISLLGITNTDVLCYGGTTTVTAVMAGGTTPYTFVWQSNSSTIDVANYSVGVYSVMVTDANSCSVTPQTFTVTQPTNSLSINSIITTSATCFGDSAKVYVNVTGGTSPYNYLWQANASVIDTAYYVAGTYTMLVTDANGCATNSQIVTVTQPTSALSVILLSQQASCLLQATGNVLINVVGGTPLYTIIWSNGTTSYSLANVGGGVVTATITDANSCTTIYNTTVNEEQCVALNIPTMFTPNGDGKNDLFIISGIEYYPNNTLQIFNRWGNLVYSKKSYNNTFDGKANVSNAIGTGLLPASTYFVVFDFGDGQTKPYHGYLELKY